MCDAETKECCPVFDPEKWDEKVLEWQEKPFIKESIPLLFHIPFPPMIGKKIMKMCNMAMEAEQTPPDKTDMLVLFTDPHPFKSELYMSVMGPVPQAKNVQISGKFRCKVFDGPYNAIPKFFKEMNEYLAGKNEKASKYYVHYAYCPKCSQEQGHNYMVLFAQV